MYIQVSNQNARLHYSAASDFEYRINKDMFAVDALTDRARSKSLNIMGNN